MLLALHKEVEAGKATLERERRERERALADADAQAAAELAALQGRTAALLSTRRRRRAVATCFGAWRDRLRRGQQQRAKVAAAERRRARRALLRWRSTAAAEACVRRQQQHEALRLQAEVLSAWQTLAAEAAAAAAAAAASAVEAEAQAEGADKPESARAFAAWHGAAEAWRSRRALAAAAVAEWGDRLLLARALEAFDAARRGAAAQAALSRASCARALRAWLFAARQQARARRLWLARKATTARRAAARALAAWRVAAALARASASAVAAADAHEAAATSRAETACAEAGATALQQQLRSALAHAQWLEERLVRSGGHAAGAMAGPIVAAGDLRWRAVVPRARGDGALLARARHAALPLEGASSSDEQDSDGDDDGSSGNGAGGGQRRRPVAAMLGRALVYGGVCGERWLTDMAVVSVREEEGGRLAVDAQPVEQLGGGAAGSGSGGNGGDGGSTAMGDAAAVGPGQRRDFAACAAPGGQAPALLLHGGFTGRREAGDLWLCELQRRRTAGDESSGGSGSCGGGSGGVPAWRAVWRCLQPEHSVDADGGGSGGASGPGARSHHSLCLWRAGGCAVLFGGYAGGRGALGDVWAFDLGGADGSGADGSGGGGGGWWQPEIAGECRERITGLL